MSKVRLGQHEGINLAHRAVLSGGKRAGAPPVRCLPRLCVRFWALLLPRGDQWCFHRCGPVAATVPARVPPHSVPLTLSASPWATWYPLADAFCSFEKILLTHFSPCLNLSQQILFCLTKKPDQHRFINTLALGAGQITRMPDGGQREQGAVRQRGGGEGSPSSGAIWLSFSTILFTKANRGICSLNLACEATGVWLLTRKFNGVELLKFFFDWIYIFLCFFFLSLHFLPLYFAILATWPVALWVLWSFYKISLYWFSVWWGQSRSQERGKDSSLTLLANCSSTFLCKSLSHPMSQRMGSQ